MKELSLHILDIIENSVSGGASLIEVNITVNEPDDLLLITIIDNGRGMDSETLSHVTDPFFSTRTTRKIGMGLSLFRQQSEQTGGRFSINSELNKGTVVSASLGLKNIDRQPLGDVAGVIVNVAASYTYVDIQLNINTSFGSYHFGSQEVIKILDGVPFNNPEVMLSLKEMIETNIKDLKLIN